MTLSETITEIASSGELGEIRDLLQGVDLTFAGLEDAHFWILKDDNDSLKACVGLEIRGRNGLLRSLAVRKEFQGSGIGTTLVNHVVSIAREEKLDSLYLLTTTARNYFTRFGFISVDRATLGREEILNSKEFEACPSASVLMRLPMNLKRENVLR